MMGEATGSPEPDRWRRGCTVNAGEAAAAVGWFVVFGAVAVMMGRSAFHDWREGRRERDAVTLLSAVQQLWPAMVAGLVALAVPVVLLLNT
jgi:hypothetical protein